MTLFTLIGYAFLAIVAMLLLKILSKAYHAIDPLDQDDEG